LHIDTYADARLATGQNDQVLHSRSKTHLHSGRPSTQKLSHRNALLSLKICIVAWSSSENEWYGNDVRKNTWPHQVGPQTRTCYCKHRYSSL